MTDVAPEPLTVRADGEVAVLALDDGKANALTPSLLESLHAALDRIEADPEVRAVVIEGRPGRFSAGFDLAVMTESADSMRRLVTDGAELLMRLYGFPRPTVAACTGHALAGGALVLLACDVRIGAIVPAKIGLNEVAIGMPLPIFALELARDRLSQPAFVGATLGARVFDPESAVAAGYLDAAVAAEAVAEEALAQARALGALDTGAYGRTKELARQATIEHVRQTLATDIAALTGPSA